ncbi:1-acylglycerol-3-phosphate O-acyltransferase [Tubulinosema ratisbonensis]|uniref:1-acylglycerol-3-phosphate O-acyltransferase n=1 Tax=Tubulinosema ratisbonensis TaxID=291195 RepID=A0A437AMK7_9MICR|nr:1-acylglycerol-3-phosphate O-acyltransferase [Tubulinosema ratisbonensis]
MKRLLNILVFMILSIFYFLMCIFLFFLLIIVDIFVKNGRRREKIMKFLQFIFYHVTLIYFGFYFCKPIPISYNRKVFDSKKCLAISNHITNYDWWFFFVILNHFGKFYNLKIVLKKSLEKVPLFGYAMKVYGYIFLSRKITEDEDVLDRKLKEINLLNDYTLLFFPEGTVFESGTKERSLKYSLAHNIKINNKPFPHDRVLLPKKTGYKIVLKKMITFDSLLDFTIGTIPYEKMPYEKYNFKNIFVDRTQIFNLFFILDYKNDKHELYNDDFIYHDFYLKELALKEMDTQNDFDGNKLHSVHQKMYKYKKDDLIYEEVCTWKNRYYFVILFFYFVVFYLGYLIF